LKTKK